MGTKTSREIIKNQDRAFQESLERDRLLRLKAKEEEERKEVVFFYSWEDVLSWKL